MGSDLADTINALALDLDAAVGDEVPLQRALDELRFLPARQREEIATRVRQRFIDGNDKGAEVMMRVRIKQAVEVLNDIVSVVETAKREAEERLAFFHEVGAVDDVEREVSIIKILTDNIAKNREQAAQIERLA